MEEHDKQRLCGPLVPLEGKVTSNQFRIVRRDLYSVMNISMLVVSPRMRVSMIIRENTIKIICKGFPVTRSQPNWENSD